MRRIERQQALKYAGVLKAVRQNRGFTLIEVITVTLIIAVLAAAAIPLAHNAFQREKEIALRRALRMMRTAIDDYRKFCEENKIETDEDTYGYPEKLEDLVKGVIYKDKKNKSRVAKFLRRIPYDPINSTYEWGLRSFQDKFDSRNWGGQNVWDVYCDSNKKALDGTYYRDW
ncbi:MAG: prepilin-type N-terminal cleavage/methylation domain-containing protein [Candidatus Aminicenantes bacterium]|nr:prepilin-type N-terminal cleavage/methylation domain-containing protein [Candidatus Aminicenantes bacterium]